MFGFNTSNWSGLDWAGTLTGLLPTGNAATSLTDFAGLTDTQAGQRGLSALNSGLDTASANLDASMAPVLGMYQNAMQGRDMGSVLDQYQNNMYGELDAGNESNVQNYLSPTYNRSIANATNQALAGSGASLQSSAANNAVATGVANTVNDMWNTAFNQAMQDAQNNQGIYSNVTQANLSPSQNWAQLASDIAGTKYTTAADAAQAAAQVAGQNQSWFGSLF